MLVSMIETDWGPFKAPDDLPPMQTITRPSVFWDDGTLVTVTEPVEEHKTAFWQYVKAQGERLRDSLPAQGYAEWLGNHVRA